MNALGGFEALVLLAVFRLGEDAYGAAIATELEERTGRPVSQGAVYVTLRRLQAKGLLSSKNAEGTPARGGRPKRVYAAEPAGLEALRAARRDWEALAEGLDADLGDVR